MSFRIRLVLLVLGHPVAVVLKLQSQQKKVQDSDAKLSSYFLVVYLLGLLLTQSPPLEELSCSSF